MFKKNVRSAPIAGIQQQYSYFEWCTGNKPSSLRNNHWLYDTMTLNSLRVPFGTQGHTFVNIWEILLIFAMKIAL